jgi:hypothetical protein
MECRANEIMQTRRWSKRARSICRRAESEWGPFSQSAKVACRLSESRPAMRHHSERSNRIMFLHFVRAADSLVIVLEGHLSIS